MGQLNRGLSFSDSPPGHQVTANRLHEFLEGATLTGEAVTAQEEATSLASDNSFLVEQDGELKKVAYANLSSSPVGMTGFRNLTITNNSGSPQTTVDITADEVLLRNSTNVLLRFASISESANITVAGENGLDTGSEAATWYYIWLISNGNTLSSLLSTSATAPTMPSGYDYKVRIGGVYNPSSNFWTFQQSNDIYTTVRQAITLSSTTYTGNTDPTSVTGYVTFAMDGTSSKPFVPTNACEVWGHFGRTDANASALIVSGSTAGLGAQPIVMTDSATAQDSFRTSGFYRVPIMTAQTIFLKSANASANVSRISVSGFRIKP